ncbi:ribonuclease D [Desulfovibrio sp. X2]|nr:ribonuclease D [Desulfovibrio sp. X2]
MLRFCPLVAAPVAVSEDDMKPRYVADDATLRKACASFKRSGAIGVDTEFVRVRTYFPMLGLIQVSDKRRTWLIDPLALSDLSPFAAVLTDRSVLKVMHSCSEDLEVLSYLTGDPPGPIFDTQIAASFLGHGFQSGYQQLSKELFGAEMGKSETRSDWLRRPLSENQIRYAAMDVACLLPMQRELSKQLRKLGRLSWAEEEFTRMRRDSTRDYEPEEYYLRFGGLWQYDRRELGLMRDLFAWRERRAMTRDLPRSFITQDATLRALVKHKPLTMRDLSDMEGIKPSFVRRYGRTLTRIVREAMKAPEETLPETPQRPPNPRKVGRMVEKLRPIVAETAESLGLPPELVARKRSIIDLTENVLRGQENPLPDELSGWRKGAIGDKLLQALKK